MPDLLTADEAARAVGVTRQWLGHLVRTGQIRALRAKRRRYMFRPEDIAAFKKHYPTDTNPIPTKGRT